MSKSTDLLGLIVDTSLVPADDDPGFDGQGYTALRSPEDNNPADEDEDDASFRGLLDSGLSQEEAQETVNYMRPLSKEEARILEETPGLEGLSRVDDAEHSRWLEQKAAEGNNAIDRSLEDAVYGDNMAHDEESMERADTDSESGLSFKRAFRKVGRGLKKAGRLAAMPITKPFSIAARFMPGRDARKAKLIKNVYKKLWYEHANWLAIQDKQAGIPLKPRADYEMVSKLWAKAEMKKNKLPTNFGVSGADVLGAQILGDGSMGSWAWPFGNFLNFSRTTVNSTADKRAGSPPAEQGEVEKPEFQPVTDPASEEPPSAEEQPPQPTADDQQGESTMHGRNGTRTYEENHGIRDVDSLGAFATQILGSAQPARDNPHADRIVKVIALKLKTGKPISPGELGLLSSAAREGNASAQKVLVVLESRGVAMSGDESGLDPWLYKLNPSYWIASKRKKELIDIEKKNWVDNAKLQKQLAKQKEILDSAERAAQSAQAVAAAKQQAADTEAQLKEIEKSLKGTMSGSFVGHEKNLPISSVVVQALEKTGKKERAGALYAKIKSGQPLDPDEIKDARKIANLIGRMKVVHGDLVTDSESTIDMHGAFVGACVMGGISSAKELNSKHSNFADVMGRKIASGQSLTPAERNGLAKVLGDQSKLHKFTASLVSGAAFAGCPQKKTWTRGAFVGAVKALGDQDRKMLAAIVKLAKLGNPRAQKALSELKKSGEIMGGDVMGLGIKKFFKYATAPIWLPAKGVYKGGQALFGTKGGGSPEQIRLAKMRAAAQRAKAARAKAAAADAETDAEQRAQQAIADAADAEADAADAEAFSKEQKMMTAEAEANPDTIPAVGSEDFIGATDAELDTLMKKSYVKPSHVAILKKAGEETPTGIKIRAGANLVNKARSNDPKIKFPAVKAIKVMAAKAKKGDVQSRRDLNAVKAGRIAIDTKGKLNPAQYAASVKKWDKKFAASASNEQKKQLAAQKRASRRAAVANLQKKVENSAGDRLARMSRKRELKNLAKVELKASKGDPKARAFVAKRVAASKQGDKKALAQVRGMQLGRAVRTQVTSKQEAKRMKAATKLATRIRKNDPKAIRQYEVLNAAASKGNPNAKRAMKRLALGGALVATVATGAVVLPKLAGKSATVKPLKRGTLGYKKAQQQIALLRRKIKAGTATPADIGNGANLAMQMGDKGTATFLAGLNDKTLQESREKVAIVKSKVEAGTATREEITSGAKIANQIGDKETTGTLAQAASSAPSATEKLKQVGNTVAASQAGNPEAQAKLDKALEGAKQGNVEDINTLGHVMAAKTVDAANKGQPISPAMTDAINTVARAQAGSAADQATLQRVSEAATQSNPAPEATLAASAAVGAAVLASTLANKPQAKKELLEKVNPPIPAAEKGPAQAEVADILAKANEGTVTPEEGARGVELAQRLGKPKLAAEIAAKSPPCDPSPSTAMSSLPDVPLSPIRGAGQLIKESLKAITLTTRDPIANYREGIASRSGTVPSSTTVTPTTSSGWSPFKYFQAASKVAPFTPLAAPFAAASALASAARKKATPAPGPAPAQAPAAEAPAATSTAGTFVGATGSFKDLIANALRSKKMSKPDFNRAVEDSAGPEATPFAKKALAEQTLKFLQDKKVTVGGTFVGASDADLEKLMSQALTDDQLDHLMTKAMKNDNRIKLARLVRKRPDLKERVSQRASDGHLAAAEILKAAILINKAESGDHTAKKAFVDWCSTPSHSSSSGDFVGTFVGKSDEFKQLIIAALKTKKMGKGDFNKAVAAHVKPGSGPAERTAAGEQMLKFLASKNVKVG